MNQKSITSVPDARLYGVGGVASAGFPASVQVFEGPLSATSAAVGGIGLSGASVTSVALDSTDSNGAVYVSSDSGQILKFARPNPNGTAPTATVSGFAAPEQLDFDNSGNLFAMDANTVYVVKHPITSVSAPQAIINGGTVGLVAFALDAGNNLDVLKTNTSGIVSVLQAFTPPYTGAPVSTSTVPPGALRCVFDKSANLLFILGINLDSTRNIWTYPMPLTANESPSAKFSLQEPVTALTFDSNGNSFLALDTPNPNDQAIGGSVAVANPPFNSQTAFTFATPYSMGSLAIGP